MARRTKAKAEQTRLRIIDAARRVFHQRGVSHTTLEQIAVAAGVTRGAVYWHFRNKTELFVAMRERVSLPLIDSLEGNGSLWTHRDDPLLGIEKALFAVIDKLAQDPTTRQTHQILAFRCEYVDDFAPVLERLHRGGKGELNKVLVHSYRRAKQQGQTRPGVSPAALARDTVAFLGGLVYAWLAHDPDPAYHRQARQMIRDHVALRRE